MTQEKPEFDPDPLDRLVALDLEDTPSIPEHQQMPSEAMTAFELWRSLKSPSDSELGRLLNVKPAVIAGWRNDYDWRSRRDDITTNVPSFQETLTVLGAMRMPLLLEAFNLAMNGTHEMARANLLRDLLDRAGISPEIVQSILEGDLTPGSWNREDLDVGAADAEDVLRQLRSGAPR